MARVALYGKYVADRKHGAIPRAETAIECAKVIVEYCKNQQSCQNCIFRQHGSDHWNCHIEAFDLRDVLNNIEAKKKNHGYI